MTRFSFKRDRKAEQAKGPNADEHAPSLSVPKHDAPGYAGTSYPAPSFAGPSLSIPATAAEGGLAGASPNASAPKRAVKKVSTPSMPTYPQQPLTATVAAQPARSAEAPAAAKSVRPGLEADKPLAGSTTKVKSKAKPAQSRAQVESGRQRIVALSLALVCTAMAVMLHRQFGAPLASSVAISVVAFTLCLLVNDRAQKRAEISRLAAEVAFLRSATDVDQVSNRASPEPGPAGHAMPDQVIASPAAPHVRPAPQAMPSPATPRHETASAADAPTLDYTPATEARWEAITTPGAGTRQQPVLGNIRTPHKQLDDAWRPASPADASVETREANTDPWSFRPRETAPAAASTLAPINANIVGASVVAETLNADRSPSPTLARPRSNVESDLERVQRKIKELADEVNGADAARKLAVQPAPELDTSIDALQSVAQKMRAATDRFGSAPLVTGFEIPSTAERIAVSTPVSMSAAVPQNPVTDPAPVAGAPQNGFMDFVIPATAERIAGAPEPAELDVPPPRDSAAPEPSNFERLRMPSATLPMAPSLSSESWAALEARFPENAAASAAEVAVADFASQFAMATARSEPRIAAISRAIEAGRMDVLLSPIVGLMSNEVSHYELRVQLKTDAGQYFEDPAQELMLAGSDMLALFDTARLSRAATIAKRLASRGKPGSLLSEVAGGSITDGGFLEAFAKVYEERDQISSQLVLTFAQADIEAFSASAWQALSDMQAFGFRFAVDRLDHLSMDFAQLARSGFTFVKMDAGVLVSGMPTRDRFISADEVCGQIAGAGITLIADAITDDAMRARLFGFGVLFGQGQLFGGARLVNSEAPTARSTAA